MSKSNKHHINWIKCPSVSFLEEIIGTRKNCPKRSCKGMCVEVLVRYSDHGLIHHEYECTTCGKVIKDYQTIEKEKKNQNNYRRRGNVSKPGSSRFRTSNSFPKR